MPSADTFDVDEIAILVQRYLRESKVSVDPFARNRNWATYTNDINPKTSAHYHMDAERFLLQLADKGVCADLMLFDPPYSPRQIAECYRESGINVEMSDTQNSALYSRTRDAAMTVLSGDATVISFGWNSAGMGQWRGFEIAEILLVAHGAAHNDTICTVERRIQPSLYSPRLIAE